MLMNKIPEGRFKITVPNGRLRDAEIKTPSGDLINATNVIIEMGVKTGHFCIATITVKNVPIDIEIDSDRISIIEEQ